MRSKRNSKHAVLDIGMSKFNETPGCPTVSSTYSLTETCISKAFDIY